MSEFESNVCGIHCNMMAKVNSLSISDGDKPRALRFAEMLMNPIPTTTDAAIALELRRLHEVNQMLVGALEITVPYLPAKTATLSEVEDALAQAKEQA